MLGFFRWFGPKRSQALRFICSDMWKAYLRVVDWFRARGQPSAGAVEGLNGAAWLAQGRPSCATPRLADRPTRVRPVACA